MEFFSCRFFGALPSPVRTRAGVGGSRPRRGLPSPFFLFFFTPVRSGTGAAAQPSAAVAGRTAEVFFLGGVPSFFRARQEAAWGASRRRVLRRSPFFFSVFASLAEAPALQAPEGGGVQLRQGAFFPLRFSFFFRSLGRTGRALSSP